MGTGGDSMPAIKIAGSLLRGFDMAVWYPPVQGPTKVLTYSSLGTDS